METIVEERMYVCRNHPKQQQIFHLEKMLIEAGYPYFFNFWEDLRPVFGEPEKDPEGIDWNSYKFLIEVGRPAGYGLSEISVCFNQEGDRTLLELLDMRPAAGGELYRDLTSEGAMEIIEKFFKDAR